MSNNGYKQQKAAFSAPAPFSNDQKDGQARKRKKIQPGGQGRPNPSGIPTRKIRRGNIAPKQGGMAVYGANRQFRSTVPLNKEQIYSKLMAKGQLSPCAKLYAQALINPFGDFEGMPCIPDLIATPSFKFAARATGIFTIGTTGIGFVAVNPFSLVTSAKQKVPSTSGGSALFQAPVYATTAAYALSGIQVPQCNLNSDPAGFVSSLSDSPFGAFDNKYKVRLVGCGIKTRYMGKELDRAGRVVLYTEPSNITIGAGQHDTNGVVQDRGVWQPFNTTICIPISELMHNKSSTMTVASRKVQFVNYKPSMQEELSYKTFPSTDDDIVNLIDTYASWGGNWPLNGGSADYLTATPRYSMLYYVDGATPSSSWEFECIAFYEVTGTDLPNITMSHSDPVGLAAVNQAQAVRHPVEPPEKVLADVTKKADTFVTESSGFANTMSGIASMVAHIL